jgi:hypothetical protein
VRLADLRVPRLWWVSVLAAMLLVRRRATRQLEDTSRNVQDVAEVIAGRWQDGDSREEALLRLTRALVRLTWVLAVLTAATLAVAVIALTRA